MNLIKKSISLFVLITLFTSCVSKKNIIYFQNDEIEQTKVSNAYKTIFKPDDLLLITVSALDEQVAKPFNLYSGSGSVNSKIPFLVSPNGEIDFPILGKIKIGGLTREEAVSKIKSKLSAGHIKNPGVNIKISNYKITVLGNVKNPGSYTIPNERITILEALGLAGDLNISGQRNNIKVQREENGKKTTYVLDIRSNKIFTSPAYYLQQNDVVYVEHNYAAVQSASYNQNTGLFISIASVLISLITILSR